jgi:hypothetical protein
MRSPTGEGEAAAEVVAGEATAVEEGEEEVEEVEATRRRICQNRSGTTVRTWRANKSS